MNLTQFGSDFVFGPTGGRASLGPPERKLPYRLAVPVIATLSIGLWAILWKCAALAARLVLG